MGIFSKNAVGVDIADSSIEVISLSGSFPDIKILGKGRIELSPGIVERGRIKDPKKLSKALKKVLKEAKPRPISSKDFFVVLPEAVCYTSSIDLVDPDPSISNIRKAVYSLLPIPENNSTFAHKINKIKNRQSSLVIATQNEVLAEWQGFFKEIGFGVQGFDSEPLALYRGLFSERKGNNVVIVDIGTQTTNVSIFFDGFLSHSYFIDVAGQNITEDLMKTFSISSNKADKIKKEKGLSAAASKESNSITKTLNDILKNIGETILYFEKKFERTLDEVILVGGTSAMPGIDEYFEANLNKKTRVGSPFIMKKIGIDSILYIEAIGLAIRGIDDTWNDGDPLIEYQKKDTVTKAKKQEKPKPVILNKKSNTFPVELVESRDTKSDTTLLKDSKSLPPKRNRMPRKMLILLSILGLSIIGLVLTVFLKKNRINKDRRAETIEVINKDTINLDEIGKGNQSDGNNIEVDLVRSVIISETPTGWLNVRSGPGINHEQIARVNPGESYEFVEGVDGWYKIKVNGDIEGWISSQYADVKVE